VRSRFARYVSRSLVALLVLPTLMAIGVRPAAAAGFAPGNLVVVRVGTGSGALSGAAAPVFLDEYTPAGSLVQTIPMPTAGSGGQRRLTMSGSASSEGALALSGDGHYLTLGGYDADAGTAGVASTTSAAVRRVVGRVGGDEAGDVGRSGAEARGDGDVDQQGAARRE